MSSNPKIMIAIAKQVK